ncbi:MAG: hypothetical protein WD795_13665 [Woeseia sp.]
MMNRRDLLNALSATSVLALIPDDGPPPRGERWCNNGLALRFVPDGESLPELRS